MTVEFLYRMCERVITYATSSLQFQLITFSAVLFQRHRKRLSFFITFDDA